LAGPLIFLTASGKELIRQRNLLDFTGRWLATNQTLPPWCDPILNHSAFPVNKRWQAFRNQFFREFPKKPPQQKN
jgi:hypothetical protein